LSNLQVLHVIGGGDTGGAMSHLLPLLSALQRTGCDPHLLCLGDGGLAQAAGRRGLSVTVLPMAAAWDPRALGPLRRVIADGPTNDPKSSRWDVVHTHGMRSNLATRIATRGIRNRPCLFTTVHSDLRLDYYSVRVSQLYEVLDRATVGWVDRIICVSVALKALLVERGYPADRLLVVRSGLETSSTQMDNSMSGEFAAERPRIGTVARLVAVKDLALMLEVAALLRRTHPEIELVIVGDGPERGRLEELAAEPRLAGAVRFTGSTDDVGAVLSTLDVYLVTSAFEGGVSMAVLEAMAAGLPVVTTAAGGVAEAVVDGETGYVVTRDLEWHALASALAERAAALLDDSALRARMGAAGTLRARSVFAVEETAERTLRAYERCLAARSHQY
jgi:glycosyltransferase involved in cell wall biosynthesis